MDQRTDIPATKPGKTLAIASLVFSLGAAIAACVVGPTGAYPIWEIPASTLFLASAAAIALGITARRKAVPQPTIYKGKVVASLAVVFGTISLLAAMPMACGLLPNLQSARETAARQTVKAIGQAQAIYISGKGHGHYGTLNDLVEAGILDPSLRAPNGTFGYVLTTTPIDLPGGPAMYDTTARPIRLRGTNSGKRSFASNETNVIYEAEGSVILKATATDRVIPNAKPVQ